MLTFAALIMSIVVSEYIQKLNDAQREAVVNFRCPSLIVAGAGSGKTRVLTCRIAYMLEQGVAPDTILALTFTNKAAAEMRERIGQLLSPQATRRIWMGTFHSLFSRILRAEADKLGYPSSYTIYDASDARNLVMTPASGWRCGTSSAKLPGKRSCCCVPMWCRMWNSSLGN